MSLARIVADNFPITPTKTVLTGNGSTVSFTIAGSTGLTNANELIVTLDGALQEPVVDYTVNNDTITFTTAPDNEAKVVVVYRNAPYTVDSVVPNDGSVTNIKLGAGSVTPDKLSTNAPTWNASTGVLTLNGGTGTAIGNGVSRGLFDDGSNIALRPPVNGDIYLQTNAGTTTNLFVDSSEGRVGVGTTTPASKLSVGGGNVHTQTNGYGLVLTDASGTNPMLISQSDNNLVLYGTNSSGAQRSVFSILNRSNSSALQMTVPLDMNGNDIRGSVTTAKAFVVFTGTNITTNTIASNANSITTTAGQNTGIWTSTGWTNRFIGMTYYINVANAYNPLGGIPAVAGKGVECEIIEIISSTQVRVRYTQNASTSVNLVGTGTVAGWLYTTNTIKNSFNISTIGYEANGLYTLYFTTPMPDINYAVVGSSSQANSSGYAFSANSFAIASNNSSFYNKTTTSVTVFCGDNNIDQGYSDTETAVLIF